MIKHTALFSLLYVSTYLIFYIKITAAGAEWKALSDAEKTQWVKVAAEDRERYEREMADYKA